MNDAQSAKPVRSLSEAEMNDAQSAKPVGSLSEAEVNEVYAEYTADFFDFIISDECHRGGANEEGKGRGI